MVEDPIYFFGRNTAMMSLVDQQLHAAGIPAKGFMDEQVLMDALKQIQVRMVVVGGGVEEEPRIRLRSHCAEHGIPLLEHFGGPAQLVDLINETLGRS